MWPAIISAAGAIGGALLNKKASKDAAAAQAKAAEGDPRIASILHGKEGQPGLLSHYQSFLSRPENPQLAGYEQANLNYLSNAPADMQNVRSAAQNLMLGTQAPTIANAAWAKGNMVDAPKQNNIDLAPAYQNMIYGDAGANPYLNKAIQGGIDQSKNAFNQMQSQATEHLKENVLSGIRSNSVLAGQYGGSRQGIAEGNAIGDFAKAQQQAINQFGQANTNAAVSAQADAFNRGQDRALSAMTNLSGQQYNVAQQNAATKNAAEFMNVGQVLDISKANAGFQQANNALNQSGAQAGAGMLNGMLGNAYNTGQNHANYDINQATKVNNLMQPYLSHNPVQPIAPQANTAGGMIGGAMLGLSLYNQFKGAGGTGQTGTNSDTGSYFGQNGWMNNIGG